MIVGDRNLGNNDTTEVMSYHSFILGEWRGNLAWNDGHISLEQSHYVETRYGNGAPVTLDNAGLGDNIFNGDLDNNLNQGNDSVLIPGGDWFPPDA